MDLFLLSAFLLLLCLTLFAEEMTADHRSRFRIAVYVAAVLLSSACMTSIVGGLQPETTRIAAADPIPISTGAGGERNGVAHRVSEFRK
jgi:hypothetical protein